MQGYFILRENDALSNLLKHRIQELKPKRHLDISPSTAKDVIFYRFFLCLLNHAGEYWSCVRGERVRDLLNFPIEVFDSFHAICSNRTKMPWLRYACAVIPRKCNHFHYQYLITQYDYQYIALSKLKKKKS